MTLGEPELDRDLTDWFATIGGAVVSFGCGRGALDDVDGKYRAWFADHGVAAALQRPDFSLFGTATRLADAADLVHALRASVGSA